MQEVREDIKRTIGLVVNPVARMGGSVGLKGTDRGTYKRALELGAEPVTPRRTKELLARIQHNGDIILLAAAGKMGVQYVEALGATCDVVSTIGDETSHEFSDVTYADLVSDHPNLVVVRTMDEAFGLAGARTGYAIAGETALDQLASFYVFLPRPSLYAAIEALQDPGYMRENVRRIVEERERLRQALEQLGARVYPSSTNFLLARTEMPDLAERLREAGVLVSDVSNQMPPGFVRVSVGTPEENDVFLARYKKVCQSCD